MKYLKECFTSTPWLVEFSEIVEDLMRVLVMVAVGCYCTMCDPQKLAAEVEWIFIDLQIARRHLCVCSYTFGKKVKTA
jgi:hypothetical protein